MIDLYNKNSDLLATPEDHTQKFSVAILLCTYNGARFLVSQLESIESQHHENWFVVASDDGSTDQTLEILKEYQSRWPEGKLAIRGGPQKGFCQNFLSLACDDRIKADYYAFCDQDDVWLPTKLTTAMRSILKNQKSDEAYLYCGRTTYVDEKLRKVGISPLFPLPKTFRNALVQSVAGGNTMVFNHQTKEYLEKVGLVNHLSHDWWLYQLVTGVGGVVVYDTESQVLYRQHKEALVGGNSSIFAGLERISLVLKGRLREWNDVNIAALDSIRLLLTQSSQETLELFKKMRDASISDRLRLLKVAGLYRQTRRGTVSLLLATFMKKI